MHGIMRCISCILSLLNYKTSFGHSNTFAQERVKLARYLLLCVAITCQYTCHESRFYALYSWRNYNIIANIELLFIIVFFSLPILNIDLYMSHLSPNRPIRDPHYFGFFLRNMLKGVPKKSHTRSFRFFEKFFGVNITQNNSKNWKWNCWS